MRESLAGDLLGEWLVDPDLATSETLEIEF